jgi:hypothetical protein
MKPKNEIWDTISKVWGIMPVTGRDCTRLGALTRDFKAKGATAESITWRGEGYRKKWPKMAFTPEALLKHWELFAPEKFDKSKLQLEENMRVAIGGDRDG